MNNFNISVYVWGGKAYVPATSLSDSGFFVDAALIQVVNLDEKELKSAIEKVLLTRSNCPRATLEDVKKAHTLMLKATKVSSWKKLARSGTVYTLSWDHERICIYMGKSDKNGIWVEDREKTRELAPDTLLETMVAIIMADVASRPELNDKNPGMSPK